MKRVLFVCLGNICRSPIAHAVFRHEIERRGLEAEVEVDSCGTSAYHVGEQADSNMRSVSRAHGVDLEWHRSRQLQPRDFGDFDLLVAMDRSNESGIRRLMPAAGGPDVVRFMSFVPNASTADCPDPYYGGRDGFEEVFALVSDGVPPLMDYLLNG